MARDSYGNEIHPGDTVRCITTMYTDMEYGYETVVDATSTTAIYLREFNHKYDTPARYNSWNFIRIKSKGTKSMKCIAIRVDQIPAEISMVSYLNNNNIGLDFHSESSMDLIKEWASQRIALNPHEKWIIFSAQFLAEIAGPPVKFKSIS